MRAELDRAAAALIDAFAGHRVDGYNPEFLGRIHRRPVAEQQPLLRMARRELVWIEARLILALVERHQNADHPDEAEPALWALAHWRQPGGDRIDCEIHTPRPVDGHLARTLYSCAGGPALIRGELVWRQSVEARRLVILASDCAPLDAATESAPRVALRGTVQRVQGGVAAVRQGDAWSFRARLERSGEHLAPRLAGRLAYIQGALVVTRTPTGRRLDILEASALPVTLD